MTPIVALLLGLLIGWIIEWVIDWLYWRRRYLNLQDSAVQYQQQLSALESELLFARSEVQPLQNKIGQLELEKAQLEIRTSQIEQEFDASQTETAISESDLPDNLQEIKGIGLVISKRLNHHGIFTFEELAAQTPQFLEEILGDMVQRLADEESIVEQARQLALRKQIKGTGGQ
jgi:predicted flap endonuclease-1-like 5' DNA nuclease